MGLQVNSTPVNFVVMESNLQRVTAENVRAALAKRNLKRGALMHVLDLSYTAIHRRFQGVIPFNVEELDKIATFLGTTVTALVDDHSDVYPPSTRALATHSATKRVAS